MTVKRCGNCAHPIYQHEPDDLELCRVDGCSCPGFLTVKGRVGPPVDRARLERAAFRVGLNHLDPEWKETVRVMAAEYDSLWASSGESGSPSWITDEELAEADEIGRLKQDGAPPGEDR